MARFGGSKRGRDMLSVCHCVVSLSRLALVAGACVLGETALGAAEIVSDPPKHGRFVETDAGYMIPYVRMLPGTKVQFEMVPIPGGVFTMGSPAGEAGRREDEGPQIRVRVEPLWTGKFEVTWAEYELFMAELHQAGGTAGDWAKVEDEDAADAVSLPSPLYDGPASRGAAMGARLRARPGGPASWRQIIRWPDQRFGAVTRGGSCAHKAADLRSAARLASRGDWQDGDAELPRSLWWLRREGAFIGFRIVRPLYEPDDAEKQRWWEAEGQWAEDHEIFRQRGRLLRIRITDPSEN